MAMSEDEQARAWTWAVWLFIVLMGLSGLAYLINAGAADMGAKLWLLYSVVMIPIGLVCYFLAKWIRRDIFRG